MAITSKADLFALPDLKIEKITVPVWGDVHVKEWDGATREAFEAFFVGVNASKKTTLLRAKVAVLSLCDSDGKLICDDTDEDVKAMAAKSAKALSAIFDQVLKINAVNQSDVDELEKN